jgi:hypothetical protein
MAKLKNSYSLEAFFDYRLIESIGSRNSERQLNVLAQW